MLQFLYSNCTPIELQRAWRLQLRGMHFGELMPGLCLNQNPLHEQFPNPIIGDGVKQLEGAVTAWRSDGIDFLLRPAAQTAMDSRR